MKRWIAAFVAFLFLSTATLHVFAHHGANDSNCGVCHVQQASLAAAPAPAVAVAQALETEVVQPAAPHPRSERPLAAAARAPPAVFA